MHSTESLVDRTSAPSPRRAISRYSWMALLFLWLIYALNANSRQMIFYVLPSITDEFGTSVDLGGGFSSTGGYHTALYAIGALMLLAAVTAALFTRETTGWFLPRDRALI
jgi:hypothetical protein